MAPPEPGPHPALTPLRKAKIVGLNGARVYGVDPKRRTYRFGRRDLEEMRKILPFKHESSGPRNKREVQRLEFPRFSGHLMACERKSRKDGVHDAQDSTRVPA